MANSARRTTNVSDIAAHHKSSVLSAESGTFQRLTSSPQDHVIVGVPYARPAAGTMVDHELDELKREFLAEADDKVREMRAALGDSGTPESLDRLAYLAHQLKGSG